MHIGLTRHVLGIYFYVIGDKEEETKPFANGVSAKKLGVSRDFPNSEIKHKTGEQRHTVEGWA